MIDFFPFPVTTSIFSVTIPARANLAGIPLGQGKCFCVYLYLNSLVMDTQTNTATAANLAQIYYGDAQRQRIELIRGQFSKPIYVNDLSEIYLRCNGIANEVQAIAYTKAEV
jgi:hypothetical protein